MLPTGDSRFARLIAFAPTLLFALWHVNNHRWPTDDAANYLATAYRQYLDFRDKGFFAGIASMYEMRGWRPIAFPVIATPFLVLFRGNVLAATAASLIAISALAQSFFYGIARRYLGSFRAAIAAACTGSAWALAMYGTVFFGELTWLAMFSGFVYFTLESDGFRGLKESILAGAFLGLSTLVRPAETVVIALIPVGWLMFESIWIGHLRLRSACILFSCLLSIASLLAASAFFQFLGGGVIVGATSFVLLGLCFWLVRNGKTESRLWGAGGFVAVLIFVVSAWWAEGTVALYAWVHETSFGKMAQLTDSAVRARGAFAVIWEILESYLKPFGNVALLACAGSVAFGFINVRALGVLRALLIFTAGAILPICLLYGLTGTSDPRRLFIGMALLLLAAVIAGCLDGRFVRMRTLVITTIAGIQLTSLAASSFGQPKMLGPVLTPGPGIPEVGTGRDGNEILVEHLLDIGVPRGSAIGVYTIALYSSRDRIYEPAALELAALATESRFDFIYYWDLGAYAEVLGRLRHDKVRYLLVDTFRGRDGDLFHQLPAQFTMDVLDKIANSGGRAPDGLRMISAFPFGGRLHYLFEVLNG